MSKTGFNVKLYFTFATQPNTPKGGGMGAFVRQDQYGNVLLQNVLPRASANVNSNYHKLFRHNACFLRFTIMLKRMSV